jgi:hypothetical protein
VHQRRRRGRQPRRDRADRGGPRHAPGDGVDRAVDRPAGAQRPLVAVAADDAHLIGRGVAAGHRRAGDVHGDVVAAVGRLLVEGQVVEERLGERIARLGAHGVDRRLDRGIGGPVLPRGLLARLADAHRRRHQPEQGGDEQRRDGDDRQHQHQREPALVGLQPTVPHAGTAPVTSIQPLHEIGPPATPSAPTRARVWVSMPVQRAAGSALVAERARPNPAAPASCCRASRSTVAACARQRAPN